MSLTSRPPTERRVAWRVGTVVGVQQETPRSRRITLDVPGWPGSLGGQHVDVRLTAEDGYQASRSYSLASAGEGGVIQLAVDRLPDGEVSPYLNDVLAVGDEVEVHGPLGGWFVWQPSASAEPVRPVQLIAGGSGVVPMVSIIRTHVQAGDAAPFRMLYSIRSPADVFFREELAAAESVGRLSTEYVYTREAPPGSTTPAGRITRERFAAALTPAEQEPTLYVCGATPFVEGVLNWALELGHDPKRLRAERYGG